MTKLTPIQLDDNTVIYIEATEDVDAPSVSSEEFSGERGREDYGLSDDVQRRVLPNFQAIQTTIHAYTVYTLSAFKKSCDRQRRQSYLRIRYRTRRRSRRSLCHKRNSKK